MLHRPPLRIRPRVAEHGEEGGAEEVVEEAEAFAALAPDGVGFVEDRRDAFLFGEGGERDKQVVQVLIPQVVYVCASSQPRDSPSIRRRSKEV